MSVPFDKLRVSGRGAFAAYGEPFDRLRTGSVEPYILNLARRCPSPYSSMTGMLTAHTLGLFLDHRVLQLGEQRYRLLQALAGGHSLGVPAPPGVADASA